MWSPWFQIDGPVISMSIVGGGTGPGGTEVEWSSRGVLVTDLEGGVWTSGDVYAGDDAAGAQARFEERVRSAVTGHPLVGDASPEVPENRADLAIRDLLRRWTEDGPDAVGDLLAHDLHWEDRRAGLGVSTEGPAGFIEHLRAVDSIMIRGASFGIVETIAQRGERLVLHRMAVEVEGLGRVVEMLGLGEIDDDGLSVAGVFFDPEDLPEALDELEERYLAGEGAEHAASKTVENVAARSHRAFVDRWMDVGPNAVRDLLAENSTMSDRRLGLSNTVEGVDGQIANLHEISGVLSPERNGLGQGGRWEVFELLAERGDRLALFRAGVDGEVQIEVLSVIEVDEDGRRLASITFDPGDLADALAEMEERHLAIGGGEGGENLATRGST